jgi:hypothetical protein
MSFDASEVTIQGCPIFEEAIRHGGTLEWRGQEMSGEIVFTAMGTDGSQIGKVSGIPSKLSGGRKELRLEGEWPEAPLSIRAVLQPDKSRGPLTMSFRFARWHGQPIRQLAYFDQVADLFSALRDARESKFEWVVRGNPVFAATIPKDGLVGIGPYLQVLETLRKARRLAEHFNVNPPVPAGFDSEKAEEISLLHAIMFEGGFRERLPAARVSFTLASINRPGLRKLLAELDQHPAPLSMYPHDKQTFPFLDTEVVLEGVEHYITNVVYAGDRSALRRRLTTGRAVNLKMEFMTTTDSERMLQIKPPDQATGHIRVAPEGGKQKLSVRSKGQIRGTA